MSSKNRRHTKDYKKTCDSFMTHNRQTPPTPWSASLLRRDLNARAQHLAINSGLPHDQTTGTEPSILFGHEEQAKQSRHGNFHPASYAAICANPAWSRRLTKAHTAHRRVRATADWQWMELDCANSSDALLMNIFCHPAVFSNCHLNPAVANLLGVPSDTQPNFGVHPGVPLKRFPARRNKTTRPTKQQAISSALFSDISLSAPSSQIEEEHHLKDRTEIDLQLGALFIEAKLTESNFQTASPRLIERYRDLETIFAVERLPSKIMTTPTQPSAEDFSDLEEPSPNLLPPTVSARSRTVIQGYQLIRNVLAAFASDASFCVLCDARRRDLIAIWYSILSAVHYPSFAWRLKLLTWQELTSSLPEDLQQFLEAKYGILPA
ncbi:PGN_0703 family putative restriction endonuclease [Tunturiibacter gelidoferens]|uniref:Uncharacterized protein n=1 Tax=Tunturiibacter lichenicola TaxID=2051959 RepID=A0A7Y9NK77_9BACT|nr:hypothetical protein [Edaphobacter lichenicola]NYF50333.1 hypothetical protein [Edaphobacter lichenicola]